MSVAASWREVHGRAVPRETCLEKMRVNQTRLEPPGVDVFADLEVQHHHANICPGGMRRRVRWVDDQTIRQRES